MTIEEYFGDWSRVINLAEANNLINRLKAVKDRVCPCIRDVYKAFSLCKVSDLKVVILGFDPYNDFYKGKPRATGLAFANSIDTPKKDYSPSLKILMESVIDFTIPHQSITFDASLESWEKQGVLMLNSALSCLHGEAGSHILMWRPFIKSLLTNLSLHTTGIVYVLMGSDAKSFEAYINNDFNHVLSTAHPAYYARNKTRMPSDIWREIDKILIGKYGSTIEWYKELNLDE